MIWISKRKIILIILLMSNNINISYTDNIITTEKILEYKLKNVYL